MKTIRTRVYNIKTNKKEWIERPGHYVPGTGKVLAIYKDPQEKKATWWITQTKVGMAAGCMGSKAEAMRFGKELWSRVGRIPEWSGNDAHAIAPATPSKVQRWLMDCRGKGKLVQMTGEAVEEREAKEAASELYRMMEDNYTYCKSCKEIKEDRYEPDARGMKCEDCGARELYGLEWAVSCGWVTL